MRENVDKKITFALWALPFMLAILVFVVYQNAKVRGAQIDNMAKASPMRELTLSKEDTILKLEHCIKLKNDTILSLLKQKP